MIATAAVPFLSLHRDRWPSSASRRSPSAKEVRSAPLHRCPTPHVQTRRRLRRLTRLVGSSLRDGARCLPTLLQQPLSPCRPLPAMKRFQFPSSAVSFYCRAMAGAFDARSRCKEPELGAGVADDCSIDGEVAVAAEEDEAIAEEGALADSS
jgi:hypothetical protein